MLPCNLYVMLAGSWDNTFVPTMLEAVDSSNNASKTESVAENVSGVCESSCDSDDSDSSSDFDDSSDSRCGI